jgi:hypothetical protein
MAAGQELARLAPARLGAGSAPDRRRQHARRLAQHRGLSELYYYRLQL